jgi:AcrR family transcriptional regulator
MSVEWVAERAQAGKTTIYRRWSSKEELVCAAVESVYPEVALQDTGSTRGDLTSLLEHFLRFLTSTTAGRLVPGMAGHIVAGTPLAASTGNGRSNLAAASSSRSSSAGWRAVSCARTSTPRSRPMA